MITKITITNFKKLTAELDLSSSVIFVGPNNSGKTSALQAIALWNLALRKWAEISAERTKGITINRKDLLAAPVPSAAQLWKDLRVRTTEKVGEKQKQKNIYIDIIAEGFTEGKAWKIGFAFSYYNSESLYCRILEDAAHNPAVFSKLALTESVGLLPPMSGLSSEEDKLTSGSIQGKIGEGKTAEVLRNLCLMVYESGKWDKLAGIMEKLFRVKINEPIFMSSGKISMTYREGRNEFDLSNSGRGFQQILLLFAYIYSGDNKILLIDEPDAHLEIIRQKNIFNILSETVKKEHSQLIIATHSEAILQEAWQKDKVIAFIGKPHIANINRRSQIAQALTDIGYDQYLLAEERKWVLYLEGSTDLAVLKAFATVLRHPAAGYLENPFVKYCGNIPGEARKHFNALKEAVSGLVGVAIFDNLSVKLQSEKGLEELMWTRREIENYLPIPQVLERYASQDYDLFSQSKVTILDELVGDYMPPRARKDSQSDWWSRTKMSDDFLDKIFIEYFQKLKAPVTMDKGNYYQLAELAKPEELDNEIKDKLDKILEVAKSAN